MPARQDRTPQLRRYSDMPWTVGDHEGFEGQLGERLDRIERELVRTRIQLTLVLGGVAVIAFMAPLVVTVVLFLANMAGPGV